jgi:cytochrome c-type biogenesis protein CcmE
MNNKYIFGGFIIVVFFGVMAYLFTQTNVAYEEDFSKIKSSTKTIKATGSWVKAKNFNLDTDRNLFSFHMADYNGTELKVMYKGAMPNNFESSTSVVVTGKYKNGVFHASDILTKCPSKYETEYEQQAKS